MAPTGRSAIRAAAAVLVLALAGCDGPRPSPGPPSPSTRPAALAVETVAGADRLDEAARTELEVAVGDVLSGYVSRAFLGEFPRQDFVPAFESFTSGAARRAAGHIDQLTASSVEDATAVQATRLDSRLSFLEHGGEVLGATAAVDFAFEATMPDGTTRPVTMSGRLMLQQDAGTWSVFGYDVALDDGAPVTSEDSS